MCKINAETVLTVMKVSKSIYKSNESSHKIKRISLLLASVLLYIYTKKDASTLDMYELVPYSVSSQINILNNLIDLGYIYKHEKKMDKSSIYSVTVMGSKVVEESWTTGINKNYTPNKYKTKATGNRVHA